MTNGYSSRPTVSETAPSTCRFSPASSFCGLRPPTTMAARPLPVMFVSAQHSLMNLSMPSTIAHVGNEFRSYQGERCDCAGAKPPRSRDSAKPGFITRSATAKRASRGVSASACPLSREQTSSNGLDGRPPPVASTQCKTVPCTSSSAGFFTQTFMSSCGN